MQRNKAIWAGQTEKNTKNMNNNKLHCFSSSDKEIHECLREWVSVDVAVVVAMDSKKIELFTYSVYWERTRASELNLSHARYTRLMELNSSGCASYTLWSSLLLLLPESIVMDSCSMVYSFDFDSCSWSQSRTCIYTFSILCFYALFDSRFGASQRSTNPFGAVQRANLFRTRVHKSQNGGRNGRHQKAF